MQSRMILVWLGALLVIVGLLFTAGQAIWRGRLSEARQSGSGAAGNTLEPRERAAGFGLKANWPGLAMIGLGFILMAVGAAL
jgi:hypothetical protein